MYLEGHIVFVLVFLLRGVPVMFPLDPLRLGSDPQPGKIVGRLTTGHLPTIGTLLMRVKSIDVFMALFFLSCGSGSMVFWPYKVCRAFAL